MKKDSNRTRNDMILVSVILIISALAVLISVFAAHKDNSTLFAVVSIDGEVTAKYPMSDDAVYTLGGGNFLNILVIEGGKAYISDADCPEHLCVKQGKISKIGQTIVCLPHRVVVSIE